jgi:hypothetical protein
MKQKGFDHRHIHMGLSILSHNLWVTARVKISRQALQEAAWQLLFDIMEPVYTGSVCAKIDKIASGSPSHTKSQGNPRINCRAKHSQSSLS